VPALLPYIFEPIWRQFSALLPEREVDHPLGCHRPRIPDRVVFEKLVQVLVLDAPTGALPTSRARPLL
jgi:transposase